MTLWKHSTDAVCLVVDIIFMSPWRVVFDKIAVNFSVGKVPVHNICIHLVKGTNVWQSIGCVNLILRAGQFEAACITTEEMISVLLWSLIKNVIHCVDSKQEYA